MQCDFCFGELKDDCVLKQPCNHRIHKKCEAEDGGCKTCKTQTELKKFSDYCLLVMMGIIVGLIFGCCLWSGTNSVHTTVRELEVSLAKMRQWADRSIMSRAIVEKSLIRIKACIEKEMLNVLHSG